MTATVKPWLLALRPKTLSAAVAPVAVGSALAAAFYGSWSWPLAAFALLGAILIQVGTNFFNDALDFKKGADTAERLGPVRVTQSGLLSARAVMGAGWLAFAMAALCGIPLVLAGGWPMVAVGVMSLVMGYAYTGGPFPLAYRGLGDLFVILFFGLVAVGGVYFLHTGHYRMDALMAGLQVGCLATVLIAINNLRDHAQDAKASKRTLAVRLGPRFVRREILALWLVAYGIGGWWWAAGFPWAALLPLVTIPRAWLVVKSVWSEVPGPRYNGFLAQAALVQILFSLALTMGLLL